MKHLYTERKERLRAILIEARLTAGLTQAQLCKRLKRNRNFVSTVERGIRVLNVAEFIEYAQGLKLDPVKILSELI